MGLWSTRMIRDTRYKLVYHATERPELYDLQTDPGELHNRADDPSLREERDRLRTRLIEWMESVRDPLLNAWTRRHIWL
jgi:arylsulfatase A-like enzyme